MFYLRISVLVSTEKFRTKAIARVAAKGSKGGTESRELRRRPVPLCIRDSAC